MVSFLKKLFTNDFDTTKQLPILKVTMLGPSGVGKTSLLAAMYDQFDEISQDLQLRADEDTALILDKRLQDLKNMVGTSIKPGDGIQGTAGDEPVCYRFQFGETGANPELEIQFQDYPGGWLEKTNQIERVRTLIRESAAILIPIDAAILMENNGEYHEKFNQPNKINDLLKKVYRNLDSPRLVILAPVKCEKYMQDNPKQLFDKVKEGYKKVLNQLSGEKLLPKVAVIITPVQTVGNIVFSRIEKPGGDQITFYYRQRSPNDPYQPQNTELPLRFLLRFLLKLHLDKKRNSLLDFLLDFLGKNDSLRNAVIRFSQGSVDDIEIVQGISLLKLTD
jgi:GTPase SAR1 family protein